MSPALERALGCLTVNLPALRGYHGVTQSELANHCGCDPSHVSKVENGQKRPSLRWLGAAAELLEVEVADLLSPLHFNFDHGANP